MTLQPEQLYNAVAGRGALPQAMPTSVQPKTFAAGTGTLALLQPVAKNSSTGFWGPWNPTVTSEEWTIGTSGTVSGGSFTLTVNGETTAAIAWNASAASILAALVALGGIDPADVSVVGDMPSAVITFGGALAGQDITGSVDSGSITGGGSVTLLQEAGENPNGMNEIDGFVWYDEVTLNASGEVVGNVFMGGRILYSSIPAAVSGVYTENQLKAALRDGMRAKNIIIEGLDGVA